MNKLFTKIAGLTLGLAMAIGVGVAAGNNKKVAPAKASDVSSLTFTEACNGSGTADDETVWTVTSDGTESSFDTTKGIHYGTGSAQVGYIQLATSDISGTVTKVVVNASTANSVTATVAVTVGGDAFGGDPKSLTTSAADYTFTGSATAGNIVVRIEKPNKATKAIYCKSVVVTYEASGGEESDWETTAVAISTSETISKTIFNTETELPELDSVTVTKTQHDKNQVAEDREVDATSSATLHWADATDTSQEFNIPVEDEKFVSGTYSAKVWAEVDDVSSKDNATESKRFVDVTLTVVNSPAYTSGFETSDGFTASTTYNNSTPYTEGLSGTEWSILSGHASSTAASVRSGSMGMILRYYSSLELTPYIEMTWDVEDAHEMTFYAKGSVNGQLKVEYSTDSGDTWVVLLANQNFTSSSFSLITATIPSYVSQARFRISSLITTDRKDLYIDDLEITTMEEPTDPTVTITSKDGSGFMSGCIGDILEVTWETAHDTGLTLNWVLVDEESVVSWESPYISFEKVGADATLTAQLMDGGDVVAYDSVVLHTLVPSLDVKVNGTSRSNYALYEEDSITITATATNQPENATIVWTTNDTEMDYSTFNTSTGLFEAIAPGSVHIEVEMKYSSNVIASDFINITISELAEPTLVVSTGEGKTEYKFGEELDKSGWTATYTDGKGVAHDVLAELDFGPLEYIGTKSLTATYGGATSNAVDITVTNNGAKCDEETILEGSGFISGGMPTGWSAEGAGSNYAESHAPYRLKMDSTGDKVIATVNTSASTINVSLGIKLASGATTCTFTVTAKDSQGNEVATNELSYSGNQNQILSDSKSLSNPDEKTVTSIEFSFNKGTANVGVGTGIIAVENAETFAPKQALAYARYFLEQTNEYCDATISSSVKTSLINEFNWMIPEAKAVFKGADIVRGKGASYANDISEALSRYVNMIEEKGYSDADFLDLGEDVINKTSDTYSFVEGQTGALIITIVSLVSLTALGGYFFLRKRKEQ